MKYEVVVRLKPEVLDPEGRAIHETLTRLGHENVKDVNVSKRFEIEVDDAATDPEELVRRVADEYLANPVSQTYDIRKL